MPIISGIRDYNGFAEKIGRLGLDGLIEEAAATVTRFPLLIEERRHINGTKGLRRVLTPDSRHSAVG